MNFDLIPETAATFMLVFARVGTLVILMPGIGERFIAPRARLGFALLLTLVFFPMVGKLLPTDLSAVSAPPLVAVLIGEVAVGLIIGLATRMVMASLQTAGVVISQALGLSFAMTVDPSTSAQDASIGNFLTLAGIALIFSTDLHHMVIAAIYGSYTVLPPGEMLNTNDAVMLALMAVVRGFTVAIQISAPFLVFAVLFNLGLGVLSRLMPQMQVFFLALPATILIGMLILMAVIGTMMGVFIENLGSFLSEFIPR